MKILIINGSPRKSGLVSQMLQIMTQEAESQGAEVETVVVDRLLIRPCIGCMICRSKNFCQLPEDDAHRTLQKIQEANVLIIGSPCYWGNMNGYLKVLFDRMVYGLIGEGKYGIPAPKQKGKKAVIVTTSTTSWPFNVLFNQTSGTVKAIKQILKYSGFSVQGIIQKGGTKACPALTDKEKDKCRKIIQKIISL